MRRVLISLILALLCACSPGPKHQVETLPNGKQLKVLSINTVKMATPNGVLSYLRLDYQTDLNISDVAALQKEVDEIWPYFKNNAEQAGMDEAIIRANSAPKGTFIQETKSHAFAYEKGPDGRWSRSGG
jgi:hypothetical protein